MKCSKELGRYFSKEDTQVVGRYIEITLSITEHLLGQLVSKRQKTSVGKTKTNIEETETHVQRWKGLT